MATEDALPCTIVLHDDAVSAQDVLGGSRVLPVGYLGKLSSPGARSLYVKAFAAPGNADEISLHRSLAVRFGFENRTKGTIELVQDKADATATHVEFLFRDQHLSRADMWRLMQRLDRTIITSGQKVSFMGSLSCEIRTIYIAGREASSAYVVPARTRPIFRSASARYTLLIQVSKEMLEQWVEGQLMYERVISGFLPGLFTRRMRSSRFQRCIRMRLAVQDSSFDVASRVRRCTAGIMRIRGLQDTDRPGRLRRNHGCGRGRLRS